MPSPPLPNEQSQQQEDSGVPATPGGQGLTPEFIVVVAALRLSTAVSCVTNVALIVGTHTGFLILKKKKKISV